MLIATWKKSIWKAYLLYNFNCIIIWKRQKCGDNKKDQCLPGSWGRFGGMNLFRNVIGELTFRMRQWDWTRLSWISLLFAFIAPCFHPEYEIYLIPVMKGWASWGEWPVSFIVLLPVVVDNPVLGWCSKHLWINVLLRWCDIIRTYKGDGRKTTRKKYIGWTNAHLS